MHYKNNRPAKVGDSIVAIDFQGIPFAGIVARLNPGGGGCGLQMLPYGGPGCFLFFDPAVCVRVDDLEPKPYDPAADPDGPLSLELKAGNNAAAIVAAHVVAMGAAGATIPVKLPDGSLFTVTVSPGVPALDLSPVGLRASVENFDTVRGPGPGTQAAPGTDANGAPTPPVEDTAWMDQPRFGGEGKVDAPDAAPPVEIDPSASIAVPENPEKVN